MIKEKAEKYELILGSCPIKECGSVIKFEGSGVNQEIIRLRIGGDGKLLVNCQVKDKQGNTIAKVHNSKFVYIDPNFDGKTLDNRLLVTKRESGETYLDFEHLGGNKLKINGIFWVKNQKIIATDDGLLINGAVILRRTTFLSPGNAIHLG